jgi:hypothetical protein
MGSLSKRTRRTPLAIALVFVALLARPAAADEPGPFATPTDKLDYLLRSWRGHKVEELQTVWGKHSAIEPHGDHKIYVFERRVKVSAGVFGVAVHPNGGLRCVARFDVNAAGEIVRTSRQGGGSDCWSQFRKYEPR